MTGEREANARKREEFRLGRELRKNVSEGDGTSVKPVASETLKGRV